MARPRNFSREGVLERALPVFWKHGFADASLQELEKATGVNKSGLYSEFSGKEELFVESLRFYKQLLLARKLRVKAGFVHSGRLFQFLQAGVGKAVLPEHRKGSFEHSFAAEISRAGH